MQRWVMVHKRDGIFVGMGLGLAFFSLLDPVGQSTVATFATVDDGRKFVVALGSPWEENSIWFAPVETAIDCRATIEELKAAGLSHLLGDMEADALRYATPAGHA